MSRAFANGAEWDCWSVNWCQRCEREPTCTLLDNVLLYNELPVEWVPDQPGSLHRPYICTQFQAVPEAGTGVHSPDEP